MTASGAPALVVGLGIVGATVGGCAPTDERVAVAGVVGAVKTAAIVRAERRLFDGAPPTIPHAPLGAACTSCHNDDGMSVPELGFAPPSPHGQTLGMSSMTRCEQCHVHVPSDAVEPWVGNRFVGLRQDLRLGERLHPLAPPVVPHKVFMRENCRACHSGSAAREEIRTTHPERVMCRQCHVEQTLTARFDPR
ncbi:MAG: hypothetical protein AAGE94_20965 [Acidobacteriota bacterium]